MKRSVERVPGFLGRIQFNAPLLVVGYLTVVLCLWFSTSLHVFATSADADTEKDSESVTSVEQHSQINGWQKEDGNTYFYKDGVKQTGWQKVDGRYYYMNQAGVCQTNKIVGNKKSGYYYVDKSGIRITDTTTQYAVKFVRKHTKSSWSAGKKLKKCYEVLSRDYKYKRFYMSGHPKAKHLAGYARYMFKNKKGNCYRYAAAYAYIARVLGYDARVLVGWITSTGGGRTPHGWTEVKIGKKWYICDTNMQIHTKSPYFYYKKTTHPCRVWVHKRYTLKLSDGKVAWK